MRPTDIAGINEAFTQSLTKASLNEGMTSINVSNEEFNKWKQVVDRQVENVGGIQSEPASKFLESLRQRAEYDLEQLQASLQLLKMKQRYLDGQVANFQ